MTKTTRNIFGILIFSGALLSCVRSNNSISFKNQDGETGIYESDVNGAEHIMLGGRRTYNLKSSPSILLKEFETLKIGDECYTDELCVDFKLSQKGTLELEKLMQKNFRKSIYYVIDGTIISIVGCSEINRSGMGQFPIPEFFFDSLFVVK
ncbi:MAG: hypothetical protein ACJA1C_001528 [Crocinitomicaceae bacterium]|jgi:hypothetical protein